MSVGHAPFAQEARIIRFCPVGKLKVYRIGPVRNDSRIHLWHRTCTEKEQIFIHSHVAVVVWAPLPLCCLVQERPHGPVASGAADLRSHLSLQRRPGLLCAVRPIQGAHAQQWQQWQWLAQRKCLPLLVLRPEFSIEAAVSGFPPKEVESV